MAEYKCPVCGENYPHLSALKRCIEKHEADEKKSEQEKIEAAKKAEEAARQAEAKTLEEKIQKLSTELEALLTRYNNLGIGKTYKVDIGFTDTTNVFEDALKNYRKKSAKHMHLFDDLLTEADYRTLFENLLR